MWIIQNQWSLCIRKIYILYFFEIDAILGYAFIHNRELCIYITNWPYKYGQHWFIPKQQQWKCELEREMNYGVNQRPSRLLLVIFVETMFHNCFLALCGSWENIMKFFSLILQIFVAILNSFLQMVFWLTKLVKKD